MTFKDLLVGGPQPPWLRWVFLIGIIAAVTRLILDSRFGTTALFYVGLPYLIGLAVYFFVPPTQGYTKVARAARHFRSVIIVMLASSLILFEGMICVLFALPIYVFFASIILAVLPPPRQKPEDFSDIFRVSAVPLLVAILSIEGISPSLSFEREHTVTRTQIVNASIPQIKAKLAQPIALTETRSAFLKIFPLPHKVEAGSLSAGDIHTSHYTYKRWPIGNTHHGSLETHIKELGARHIVTTIENNDAYFSHYLTIHGTRIDMTPRADGQTEIALTLAYSRDLDPAWYFGPLQKRAIGESADYLIEQLMVPGSEFETKKR
jgi:hypothetical protein